MGMETPKTLPKGCVAALRLPKALPASCDWSVASTIQFKLRLLMPHAVELKVPRFFILLLILLGGCRSRFYRQKLQSIAIESHWSRLSFEIIAVLG